jgi:hypothetical protein
MTTTRTKEYVYKSTLRDVYGLTPSMIDELDPPDKVVESPHYTNAPSASLYLIVRVESWIDANQARVEKARASRAKRSEAAKKFHDKQRAQKRQVALEWAASVQITLEPLPNDLLERANRRYPLRSVVDVATEKGLRAFVRHRLSNYEDLLSLLRGYEPWLTEELYLKLRLRVDAVVDQAIMQWHRRLTMNGIQPQLQTSTSVFVIPVDEAGMGRETTDIGDICSSLQGAGAW